MSEPGAPTDADPSDVTLPLKEEGAADADATLPLHETADAPAGDDRPASWKDRLRMRLKDHEEDRRQNAPAPIVSSRFDVVRELGRGGMGVVLEAEDTVLKRRVALKVLLAGEFASPQALERFQIEARAAARLRHPNIVGVLEVGEEGGRQFLVMDLIEGEALDKLLRREGPQEATEAARVTLAIAEALAFAHARGVLHRDIKPANILIADGKPLLTDFGLAKEIERSIDVGNLTSSGHIMGTPAYMSPEQARGEPDAIGRRTDIYSLGATLYEMLVGRPPFAGNSLPSLLTAVANEEPTALSVLRPGLDRDLETICLKCLEKEPEQRYAGADELAADLVRFLRHESIHARRPSMSERARKWLRRNRIMARAVGLSAGVALVVMAVLTGMFLQRVQSERNRYEQAAAEARDALDVLVFGVRDDLADVPGEQVRKVRKKLLQGAVERLERLHELDEKGVLSLKTAEAYRQIGTLAVEAGDLAKAADWFEKAIRVSRKLAAAPAADQMARRDLTDSLLRSVDVMRRRGRLKEAETRTAEAVAHARDLVDRYGTAEVRLDLSRVLCREGDLRAKAGDLPRAAESFREAVELARRSLKTTGSSVAAREVSATIEALAGILEGQGQLREAEQAYEQGTRITRALLASRPSSLRYQRDLLSSLTQMIRIKKERGELAKALALGEEALALARGLVKADAGSTVHLHGLAITLALRGDVHEQRGQVEKALKGYREAIAVGKRLEQLDPDNTEFSDTVSGALERYGVGLRRQGEMEAAAKISSDVVVRARKELARTRSLRTLSRLAFALTNYGSLQRERGDLAAAFKLHSEALAIRKGLVAKDATNASLLNEQGMSWNCLGDVHRDREEVEPALGAYKSALAVRRKVLARDVHNGSAREGFSITLRAIAELELKRGNKAEAVKHLKEALASDRARVKRDGSDLKARENLASVLMTFGALHLKAGELDKARTFFGEARDLRAGIVKLTPGNKSMKREYLIALSRVADVEMAEGNLEEAGKTYAEMLTVHRDRLKGDATNAETLRDVSVALIKAGDLAERRRKRAEALALFREAVALMERRLALDESNTSARRDLYIGQVRVGKLAFALKQLAVAETACKAAVKYAELIVAKTGDARIKRNISAILIKLADVARVKGDPLGARNYLQRAVQNHRALAARDPRLAPQVRQLEAILARHQAKIAYLTGARAPETPKEHLELAYELVRRGEHAKAVGQFKTALTDAEILDSPKGHRYHAARAAARAGTPEHLTQGMTWLKAHVKQLQARLTEAKGHLGKAELPAAHRKQLTGYVKKVEAHLHEIEATTPELAILRKRPEFKALFAGTPPTAKRTRGFPIQVKTLKGELELVNVHDDLTIAQLKRLLTGKKEPEIRLRHGGVELEDGKTVKHYGIKKGAVLQAAPE